MESDLISRSALLEKLHNLETLKDDGAMRQAYEYMGIDDCIKNMPSESMENNDLGGLEYGM